MSRVCDNFHDIRMTSYWGFPHGRRVIYWGLEIKMKRNLELLSRVSVYAFVSRVIALDILGLDILIEYEGLRISNALTELDHKSATSIEFENSKIRYQRDQSTRYQETGLEMFR